MKDYRFKVSSWTITILYLCFSTVMIATRIDKLFTINGYILCILLLTLFIFSMLITFNTKIRKYIINRSEYMISYKVSPWLYFLFITDVLGNYGEPFTKYNFVWIILLVTIGVGTYIWDIYHIKNKSRL